MVSIGCVAALLVGPLAAAQSADDRATEWFVHADAPEGGDGTERAPFRTLDDLQLVTSGDTIHLAGTFRNQPLIIDDLSDVTVRQWDSMPPAVLRGDTPLTTLVHVVGDVYIAPIDPELGVGSVVHQWDDRIDEHGRHYGHLYPVNDPAQVAEMPASWHYDAESGMLSINTAGLTIEPGDYAWCRGGDELINALHFSGGSGHHVDGVTCTLWIDKLGYGVYMSDVEDCLVENVACFDTGKHAIGWVGGKNINNTTRNCETWGLTRDGSAGATSFVYYASSSDVSGLVEDCVAHVYNILDVNGLPLDVGGMTGFFSHVSNGYRVVDLEHRRCHVVGYEPGAADFRFNQALPPADPFDFTTYTARVIESSSVGCTGGNAAPNNASVRCSFRYDYGGGAGVMYATSSGNRLFEACEIIVNLHADSTNILFNSSLFSGTVRWRLVNISILETNEQGLNRRFFRMTSSDEIHARGSIFAFTSEAGFRELTSAGESIDDWQLDFSDCAYANVSHYSAAPGRVTVDEWAEVIDGDGKYLNAVPYSDAVSTAGLELAQDGPLWAVRKYLEIATEIGINAVPYEGNYGAYQYEFEVIPGDLNGDRTVNGTDLAILLGAWGSCDDCDACGADLAGDCIVDGADLAILLANWQ